MAFPDASKEKGLEEEDIIPLVQKKKNKPVDPLILFNLVKTSKDYFNLLQCAEELEEKARSYRSRAEIMKAENPFLGNLIGIVRKEGKKRTQEKEKEEKSPMDEKEDKKEKEKEKKKTTTQPTKKRKTQEPMKNQETTRARLLGKFASLSTNEEEARVKNLGLKRGQFDFKGSDLRSDPSFQD